MGKQWFERSVGFGEITVKFAEAALLEGSIEHETQQVFR